MADATDWTSDLSGEHFRLVIWDLDETFWRGTLTEGGIEYVEEHADIVRTLARRGIVSSIASKNDRGLVETILAQRGMEDFFVCTAINWNPKGPQIKALVERIGLRPESILLIDDNPLNRAEARHHVPGLRTADQHFVDEILSHPLMQGSPDEALTRLRQYRLLDQRHAARSDAQDNQAFLRQSDIEVSLIVDIEPHIDRAIELINRTNQLNFTKRRLPEDPAEARATLRAEIGAANVQAGLVRVRDRYGDHGIVGFYAQYVHAEQLIYFCFSCRTIGMGIEAWLYQRLGRPNFVQQGEVAVDLSMPQPEIDWIRLTNSLGDEPILKRRGRILLRGGCEIQSLAHFLRLNHDTVEEFSFDRDDRPVIINHSSFLAAALDRLSPPQLAAAAALGYRDDDFRSALASEPGNFRAIVLSFWADANAAVYRDRLTGLIVPLQLAGIDNGLDLRRSADRLKAGHPNNVEIRDAIDLISDRFDYLGWTLGDAASSDPSMFEETVARAFAAIPRATPIYIVLAWQPARDDDRFFHLRYLNERTRAVAQQFANVRLLDPADFIAYEEELIDATHFQRLVYFRIHRAILADLPDSPPAITGMVDFLWGRRVAGWALAENIVSLSVTAEFAGRRLVATIERIESDGRAIFAFETDRAISAPELVATRIVATTDADSQPLPLWSPIVEAASIEEMNAAEIDRALRGAKADTRAAIVEAMRAIVARDRSA